VSLCCLSTSVRLRSARPTSRRSPPMPAVTCPACSQSVSLPADGQTYSCPHCRAAVTAPTAPGPQIAPPILGTGLSEWLSRASAVALGVIVGGLVLWFALSGRLEQAIVNAIANQRREHELELRRLLDERSRR